MTASNAATLDFSAMWEFNFHSIATQHQVAIFITTKYRNEREECIMLCEIEEISHNPSHVNGTGSLVTLFSSKQRCMLLSSSEELFVCLHSS